MVTYNDHKLFSSCWSAGGKSRSQLHREQGLEGRRPLHEQRRLVHRGSEEEMNATAAASPSAVWQGYAHPHSCPVSNTPQEALCMPRIPHSIWASLTESLSLWLKGLRPQQIINTQIIRVIVSIHQWWPVSPSSGPCGYLSGFSNPACTQADLSNSHLHFPRCSQTQQVNTLPGVQVRRRGVWPFSLLCFPHSTYYRSSPIWIRSTRFSAPPLPCPSPGPISWNLIAAATSYGHSLLILKSQLFQVQYTHTHT